MTYPKDESEKSRVRPRYRKEPSVYEDEYFYSKKGKTNSSILGLMLVGMGIFIAFEGETNFLIPALTIGVGAYIAYFGIQGLMDKTARLKFAKEGLWTEKLGFIDWQDIAKAQVIEETIDHSRETILEIYLKGSIFAESNQPDERVFLTELEGYQFVEMAVETLMSKRINKS
jgi:hypothetical protein